VDTRAALDEFHKWSKKEAGEYARQRLLYSAQVFKCETWISYWREQVAKCRRQSWRVEGFEALDRMYSTIIVDAHTGFDDNDDSDAGGNF
jgi:hypothetical protein